MNNPREQFSLIYDQYINAIYRFVYLKVSLQETAEDITSRVFIKAWQSYQKDAQSIQNMNAFLYRIAGNLVIDHYREKDKKSTISTESLAQLADDRTSIHERAMINADIDKMKAALVGVKKEYQDVIIWYYLEDMSAEEITLLTGKPPGTVRVMIHRGLEMLREKLIEEV